MGAEVLSLASPLSTGLDMTFGLTLLFTLASSWTEAERNGLAFGGTSMGLPGTGDDLISGASRAGALSSAAGLEAGPPVFFGGGGLRGGTTGRCGGGSLAPGVFAGPRGDLGSASFTVWLSSLGRGLLSMFGRS